MMTPSAVFDTKTFCRHNLHPNGRSSSSYQVCINKMFDPYSFDPRSGTFSFVSHDGRKSMTRSADKKPEEAKQSSRTSPIDNALLQGVRRPLSFSIGTSPARDKRMHSAPRDEDLEAQAWLPMDSDNATYSKSLTTWETFSIGWNDDASTSKTSTIQSPCRTPSSVCKTRNEYMTWTPNELLTRAQECPTLTVDDKSKEESAVAGQQDSWPTFSPPRNPSGIERKNLGGDRHRSVAENKSDEKGKTKQVPFESKDDRALDLESGRDVTKRDIDNAAPKYRQMSAPKEKNVVTIQNIDDVSTLAGDTIDKLIDREKEAATEKVKQVVETHQQPVHEPRVVTVSAMCDISVLSTTTRNLKASKEKSKGSEMKSEVIIIDTKLSPESDIESDMWSFCCLCKTMGKNQKHRKLSKKDRQARITVCLIVSIFVALVVAVSSLAFGFARFRAT